MNFLVIHTAVSVSTILLMRDSEIIYEITEENVQDLSSKIFLMIDQAFQESHIIPNELNKIFVVVGPGSFTGIRIGLTIAKVFAWSLKIDLVPLSSLELLATTPVDTHFIVPLIDARRDAVYAGVYDCNLQGVIEDQYVALDELQSVIQARNLDVTYISYDSFSKLNCRGPLIDYVKIVGKHENDMVLSCHTVNPVYLKQTEAEKNLEIHES